jgi:hypothetical protein
MPVLLTDNIVCELELSNGTQGIFRELVYDDQDNLTTVKVNSEVFLPSTIYVRKHLYALVEINTSQVETSLDDLCLKLIPFKQLFGRLLKQRQGEGKVSKVIEVTRTQLPIVPASVIITYKVQGRTQNEQNRGRSSTTVCNITSGINICATLVE